MSSEDRFTVLDGLGNSSPWSAGCFSPVALAPVVRQHIKAGSMCVKCSPHGLIEGVGSGRVRGEEEGRGWHPKTSFKDMPPVT